MTLRFKGIETRFLYPTQPSAAVEEIIKYQAQTTGGHFVVNNLNHWRPDVNMSGTVYTSDYINNFDPTAYLTSYYNDVLGHPAEGNMLPKQMQYLHEAFSQNNIKGERLLDIGTGPTIHSLISASPHTDCIYLSDFAPQNRAVLEKWKEGKLEHSFTDIFKYVVDAEGKGEDPVQREVQMRKKITEIVAIDLLQGEPLPPSVFIPFDIVTSSLCLEAVSSSVENYRMIAKRVAKMLKIGGYLVLFGLLGEKFYTVGKHDFRVLPIHLDEVRQAWKDSGVEIVDWKQDDHSIPGSNDVSDFEGFFLMIARKTN